MNSECNPNDLEFQPVGSRDIELRFDGGQITSDGGVLLLREVEERQQVIARLAQCCTDHRDLERVEHPLPEMLRQRVFGLVLGYEDLNDHDELRKDPLFAASCGCDDPEGTERRRTSDQGAALAGKSTLNRLELGAERGSADERYCKFEWDQKAIESALVECFLELQTEAPSTIFLDVDPTDFEVYGDQEGTGFNGYYDAHCYLPLYIFAGMTPVSAPLRPGNADAPAGCVEQLEDIIDQIRSRFPDVTIVIRGDSAFSRDWLMSWCEQQEGIEFIFGFAKNSRLKSMLEPSMKQAEERWSGDEDRSEPVRVFTDFEYQTRESWSRSRRVVGKAEYGALGPNPRFVVTSFDDQDPAELYEVYCQRGLRAEQVIARQIELFAGRLSTHWEVTNQLRLYLSAFASLLYVHLLNALEGTELENAWVDTIRNKLLKIGALIELTVRRFWVRMSSAYPHAELFCQTLQRIRAP